MNKPLEKRLQRLESKQWPGELEAGFYLYELCFLYDFYRKFPDHSTAPKFLLAEFKRIAGRRKK